ncbi:MAG: hypothetical protein N2513_06400 [Deltaproteobacteria bacterium]|nr:hypothetical protein [Deltaproteobacteria bacterium]
MKTLIVYCSKTGNTRKVIESFAKGLGGEIDILNLDLTPEGWLKNYTSTFTLDVSDYNLVCFGGWVMGMRVHPFLIAYIKSCYGLEEKKVVVLLTGGTTFSKNHAYEDIIGVLNERKVNLVGFFYTPTLLGLTLNKKKLRLVEEFGRSLMKNLEKDDEV